MKTYPRWKRPAPGTQSVLGWNHEEIEGRERIIQITEKYTKPKAETLWTEDSAEMSNALGNLESSPVQHPVLF